VFLAVGNQKFITSRYIPDRCNKDSDLGRMFIKYNVCLFVVHRIIQVPTISKNSYRCASMVYLEEYPKQYSEEHCGLEAIIVQIHLPA
jgi:hypothetical protein